MEKTAYLPASEEGRHVEALLKKAFKQGLIFKVGDYGVLEWNIEHKEDEFDLDIDSDYLRRVVESLATYGIS